MLKISTVTSPESPSSYDLANWPGRTTEQMAQAPVVLEWRTLPPNNGDGPRKIPDRWLCGRDAKGNPTNPDGLEEMGTVQYIPAMYQKETLSNHEWQGALPDNPAVADREDWELPARLHFREEAIAAAQATAEVEIVVPVAAGRI